MSSFIRREIDRTRRFDGEIRCVDASGDPLAGVEVTLEQVSGAFDLGVRWRAAPEGGALDAILSQLARVEARLLMAAPPSPSLVEACAARGVKVTVVVSAPRAGEAVARWRQERLKPSLVAGRLVERWALEAGAGAGAEATAEALEALRDAVGMPVMLMGVPLGPRPEVGAEGRKTSTVQSAPTRRFATPAPAPEFGLSLARAVRERWHLAVVRRRLLEAVGRLGPCFVYDLAAPRIAPALTPRAWSLGGEERYEAEALAQWMTLCFSIPGITGVYLEDPTPLVAPDGRPKRAYKLLRKLLRQEWRTFARGKTDAEGRFRWRGFHGEYELTVVTLGGEICRQLLHSGAPRPAEAEALSPRPEIERYLISTGRGTPSS